ncbi:YciI family protein [Flindersiella endophytica]
MRYLFLGYADEARERAFSPGEAERIVEAHGEFARRMRAEGRYVAGAGLADSSATTVVHRSATGDDVVTDGPFAETKEQIGGLFLLECADLDEAIELAKQIPFSEGLSVEIRPAPN